VIGLGYRTLPHFHILPCSLSCTTKTLCHDFRIAISAIVQATLGAIYIVVCPFLCSCSDFFSAGHIHSISSLVLKASALLRQRNSLNFSGEIGFSFGGGFMFSELSIVCHFTANLVIGTFQADWMLIG
jgi:hypothetical protein